MKRSVGSVGILSISGRLKLRFTYLGERHTIALRLDDTKLNRKIAEAKAREIELQIALGTLDPQTLKREPTATPTGVPDLLTLWHSYTGFTICRGRRNYPIA